MSIAYIIGKYKVVLLSLLPLAFFENFMPSREKILIISDSQYAENKRPEAQKQIEILEARADEYTKALATIQSTIEGLKQEHGITEPARQQEDWEFHNEQP